MLVCISMIDDRKWLSFRMVDSVRFDHFTDRVCQYASDGRRQRVWHSIFHQFPLPVKWFVCPHSLCLISSNVVFPFFPILQFRASVTVTLSSPSALADMPGPFGTLIGQILGNVDK